MKFKKHEAGEGGWSEWVSPSRKQPYKFACCDCGLVHEMEFEAVELERQSRNGWWRGKDFTVPFRVLFRARRDDAATEKLRGDQAA